MYTTNILLDLSAAFDTIDHTTLLNRLSTRFGITGLQLAWLTSYLSSRTHSVCVGNSFSPITDCRTGMPQGSVLGPILFCLYISPIADIAVYHCNSTPTTHSYILLVLLMTLPQLCPFLSHARLPYILGFATMVWH